MRNAPSWSMAQWDAEQEESRRPPLDEALADVFDFSDPDLWKSNSWAMLRPRLMVHVRARVAKLEYELANTIMRAEAQPFSMVADKAQRQREREQRQRWGERACREIQQKLDRARDILRLLVET